ncbi:M16 family metallopeptidase [Paenochrobactrum sp. BZR 588]|uniref:M16 family metallopeptidase n=1 Tax=unclassified Paenochrobactrum TaxID=2639760 RepID=UPI0038536527
MLIRSLSRLLISTTVSTFLIVPVLATHTFAEAPVAPVQTQTAASQEKPEIKTSDGVASFTLQNGLKVVVIPDHRAPVVTQMIWYHVGSADEEEGTSGIAHFLEHLMFKGTKTFQAGEFSNYVTENGGQENAFTSYDYTAYYQQVSPQALPKVMEFEADRMQNLILNEEAVTTEREVIIEERRMRVDSNPGAMLSENTNATIFYNHPYRRPIIGWRQEMEKLSLDDAISFYKKYYTPNNATLIITGDVTPEKVLELTENSWAKVQRSAEPGDRERVQEPAKQADRIVTLHDERVTIPSFTTTWLVPSYANEAQFEGAKQGDAAALSLLSEILSGSTRSRLYQNFMVKQSIASGVDASYRGDALDDGTFSLFGAPRGDTTLGELELQVKDQLAAIIKDGVSEAELDQARNRLMKSVIFARDSQAGMARIYGAGLSVGQSIEDIQGWPEKIKKVTADQVKDVANRYLSKQKTVTSYLLPPDMEPKSAVAVSQAEADSAAPEKGEQPSGGVQ